MNAVYNIAEFLAFLSFLAFFISFFVKNKLRAGNISLKKALLTCVVLFFVFALIGGSVDPNKGQKQASIASAPQATITPQPTVTNKPVAVKKAVAVTVKPASKPTNTPTPKPVSKSLSLEDRIKQTFPQDSKGSTVTVDTAIDIDTGDDIPGKKDVSLDIILNGTYWDTKATKQASYQYTTDIIKKVFPMESDIDAIIFTYEVPATNAYGQENNTMLDYMTISRATYNQINFNNFDPNNIPTIADKYGENNNLK